MTPPPFATFNSDFGGAQPTSQCTQAGESTGAPMNTNPDEHFPDKHGPTPVEPDKRPGHPRSFPGPPIVLPKSERGELGVYLRQELNVEEMDVKATSFTIMFKRYKLEMEVCEKLNSKGWKVKRKDWEWLIPTGKLISVQTYDLPFLTIGARGICVQQCPDRQA